MHLQATRSEEHGGSDNHSTARRGARVPPRSDGEHRLLTCLPIKLSRELWRLQRPGPFSEILKLGAQRWGQRNWLLSKGVRWMKLEPIIPTEVSQKDNDQYSILTHI